MYLLLFNAITHALNETDVEKIKNILKQAQINAEEICKEKQGIRSFGKATLPNIIRFAYT